ncbi:mitochondrial import translocase, subunit Tom22 [Rhizopus microsporus var. microsporus]|uniref:Mitochondrial import translocase, subunit Tom22 n=2 Tax=Rhizopus microsporus TaxID=58291 RepID=A0A2G4SKK8_RHIZD|nr:mitochondrial import translocase, subunit Tom22 [Rhizopus microsporus ATCC 52813]ORE02729.1 mitochondrial import translocase, subunit Tom22 [Rhizopus microsporus var. microsporus]PHZ09317.1 mitochondrial import translocase, subunit Tom22 [Rhizopus microsporus ATCC 52813]
MVKLEEVSADQYEQVEVLSEEDYSDFSDDEFDDEDESLLDRIAALKDIIPLKHRNRISSSVSTLTSWGKTGATFVGKSAWVITTSMFLLVLPLALEIEKEQALIAYEKEAMQQQGTQQMLGSGNAYGMPQQQQQQQQQQTIRPPGF